MSWGRALRSGKVGGRMGSASGSEGWGIGRALFVWNGVQCLFLLRACLCVDGLRIRKVLYYAYLNRFPLSTRGFTVYGLYHQ
jgi:hypothetical protein